MRNRREVFPEQTPTDLRLRQGYQRTGQNGRNDHRLEARPDHSRILLSQVHQSMVLLIPVLHAIQKNHLAVQHLTSKSRPWAGAGPRETMGNLSEGGVFSGENFVATGVGQIGANMSSPMLVSMESVPYAWHLSGDSFVLESEEAFFS